MRVLRLALILTGCLALGACSSEVAAQGDAVRPAGPPVTGPEAERGPKVVGNVPSGVAQMLGVEFERLPDAEAVARGALGRAAYEEKRFAAARAAGAQPPKVVESFRAVARFATDDASGRFKAGEPVLVIVSSYEEPWLNWAFEIADAVTGEMIVFQFSGSGNGMTAGPLEPKR